MKHVIANILIGITALIALSGCVASSYAPTPSQSADAVSVLKDISDAHRKALRNAREINLYSTEKIGVDFSIPWYYGPQINIEPERYDALLNKQADLLFAGYGVRDRLSIDHMSQTNRPKVLRLGFDSVLDLYVFIFDRVTNLSAGELYSFLLDLDRQGMIQISDLVSSTNVYSRNDAYIKRIYERYVEVDKSGQIQFNLWRVSNGVLSTTTDADEYLPYSFTATIVDKLLSNSESRITAIYY